MSLRWRYVCLCEGRLTISFIFSNLKSDFDSKEIIVGVQETLRRLCGTNRLRLENRREQNKKSVLDEGRDMPWFERRRMRAIEIVHKRAMYRRERRMRVPNSGSRMGNWNSFISRRKTRFFFAGEIYRFFFRSCF